MPAAFYFAVALSVFLLMLFAARITAVKLFLKRVWSGIESTLHTLGHFPSVVLRHIDKGLIWLSRPFLTRPAKTFRRHAPSWRWTVFLVWYAGIFAAAAYAPPPVAVAALAWGIVGVVAINRAWVKNEKVRSKIGKKIDPDAESLDALAGHDLLDLEPAHPPSVSNKARNWYAPNRRARRRRGESPTSTRWPGSARPPSSASATSPRRCPTPASRPAWRGVLLDKVAEMRKVVDAP